MGYLRAPSFLYLCRYNANQVSKAELKAEKEKFTRSLVIPFQFVLLLWVVKYIEWISGSDFYQLGVYPRTFSGLIGILTAPLVHANLNHLIDNSLPLFLLLSAIFYFYREVAMKVFLLSYLFSGFWTWLGARAAYHIGASGLIYSFAAFLFFSGIIRKYPRLIAISLVVVFLYGGLIWGLFPLDPGISFESHIYGSVAGVLLAFYYKGYGPQPEVRDWETEDVEDDQDLPWDDPRYQDDEKQL